MKNRICRVFSDPVTYHVTVHELGDVPITIFKHRKYVCKCVCARVRVHVYVHMCTCVCVYVHVCVWVNIMCVDWIPLSPGFSKLALVFLHWQCHYSTKPTISSLKRWGWWCWWGAVHVRVIACVKVVVGRAEWCHTGPSYRHPLSNSRSENSSSLPAIGGSSGSSTHPHSKSVLPTQQST